MSAALHAAALQQGFSGPAAWVLKTRMINQYLGTDLMPWELAQVSEEWLTAIDLVMSGLPRIQEWKSRVDESLRRLRSQRKLQ